MKRPIAVVLLALLLMPGCLDAVVGEEHKDESNRSIDGGYDTGAVDFGAGEAGTEEAGAVPALDAGEILDLGTSLDQGGEAQAATLDLGGELRLDQGTADRQDGRAADTSDVPIVKLGDASIDTRDTAAAGPRDSPPIIATDARDAARDPGRLDGDSAGKADTKSDAKSDTKSDTKLTADAPSDAPDDPGVRLDLATADSAPEVQTSCTDPQTLCNGACVDLQTDQANCGRCGYDCSPRICTNARCMTCPTGQTACSGQCTDTLSDPANCGGCGQLCATGSCRYGVCKASTAGHIVVIGHDFFTTNADMNQLLGNAIFLPQTDPVQLTEYVGVANAKAVSNTHVAISDVATALARSVVRSATSATNIVSQLTTADVFLIQSQTLATNSILTQLGLSWTKVLTTFVHTGGILVLLDGSYPTNDGTTQILLQAGLTTMTASGVVTGDTCSVSAIDDPLATSLSATYACLQNSISFTGGNGVHVVEDLGQPVVLHVTF